MFLLIGLRVAGMAFADVDWAIVPVAIVLVLAGRALTVYPLCLLFARSRWAVPMQRSAYSVVGRPARRAGAGASTSAADVDAVQQ